MFTYQYQQPPEYHFSLDSIAFAEFVADQLKTRTDLSELKVLDLCAGCGVIGMELSWYASAIRSIDFVEVQEIYTEYFQKNVSIVNRPEVKLRWHLLNYDELMTPAWKEKYDLILSNPPYFFPSAGMLSPSEFKNRCRFFLDSTFEHFLKAIANSLSQKGEAFFLLRPLQHHGIDLLARIEHFCHEHSLYFQKITVLRGNDVIYLSRL